LDLDDANSKIACETRRERTEMKPGTHGDEQFPTVAEIGERLKLKPDTIRRLFVREPGILVISRPTKGKHLVGALASLPVAVLMATASPAT